jgi:hypothetical protein
MSTVRTSALALLCLVVLSAAPPPARSERVPCDSRPSEAQQRFEREVVQQRVRMKAPAGIPLPVHVPVKVHVVRDAAGNGGLTTAELDSAFFHLNAQAAQLDLVFVRRGGVDYIDDDHYFNNTDNTEYDNLRQVNPVSGAVNVYFVDIQPDSDGNGACGNSSFPGDSPQGIIIHNGCAGDAGNPSTFIHEMGHYFNLYHTHETTFGVECPAGTNCATTGDLLCDTPADPNLSKKVDTNCTYTGNDTPPSCSIIAPYAPDPRNIMSYSRKECRGDFTPDQEARFWDALLQDYPDLFTWIVYADAGAASGGDGQPDSPYASLGAAQTGVLPGGFIRMAQGVYGESLTLDKPVEVHRWGSSGSAVVGP